MKPLVVSAVPAGVTAILSSPACAHAVAGAHVFVSTLIIDDSAVSDEASLPTFSWQGQPGSPATYEYNFNFEYDKRITEHFGFAQRRVHAAALARIAEPSWLARESRADHRPAQALVAVTSGGGRRGAASGMWRIASGPRRYPPAQS